MVLHECSVPRTVCVEGCWATQSHYLRPLACIAGSVLCGLGGERKGSDLERSGGRLGFGTLGRAIGPRCVAPPAKQGNRQTKA
jgi:hypothetical protein